MAQQQPMDPREAKAQAKASKAYAKAQRPFYKKKRFLLPAALVGLIAVVAVAGGGGGDSATTTPAQRGGGQAQSGPQAGGGQKGSSYKLGDPVQGDKLLVTARPAGQCGAPTCKLNATYENKTNETQDEFIDRADFVLVDQQGRRFEAPASLDNVTVQPGGSKRVTFEFTDLPRDFKLARIQGDTGGATFELTP